MLASNSERRFVPPDSRHDASFTLRRDTWWHAHELGHLLTVEQRRLGDRLFGLDLGADYDARAEHEVIGRELAAMDISRRLLTAAGRADLVRVERYWTDTKTLGWDDRGRVRRLLRRFGVERLPRTRARLERLVQSRSYAALR